VVGSLRLRSANGGLDGQTRGVGATHHSDPPPMDELVKFISNPLTPSLLVRNKINDLQVA